MSRLRNLHSPRNLRLGMVALGFGVFALGATLDETTRAGTGSTAPAAAAAPATTDTGYCLAPGANPGLRRVPCTDLN